MKLFLLVFISTFCLSCTKAKSESKKHFVQEHYKKHKHTAKTRGYLSIQLQEASRDDHTISLTAVIQPNRTMPSSQGEWQLPEGVRIIDGSMDKNLNLVSGEAQTMTLMVDRESLKEGDKIFFFAYKMENGERLGTSASYVYNAKVQDAEKSSVQQKSFSKKKKKMIQ